MKNERNTNPDFFSAPVPAGTKSGDPVLVYGTIPAVAATDEGAGGNIAGRASVESRGIFDLFTADAVAAEGTKIYITGGVTTAGTLTTTSAGGTLFGVTSASAEGTGATKAAGGAVTNLASLIHIRLAKA